MKITSEKSFNDQYLQNANGDYEFQYLFNQVPMYIRKFIYHGYPEFMMWYSDGKWCLKRKDYNGDWNTGKVLFRKKTNCKFFQNAKLSVLYIFLKV